MDDIDSLLSELEAAPTEPAKRPRPVLPYRYQRVEDFNPASSDQVQELAKHFGVKLPRRKDSEDEDSLSTEKKYLIKAAKKFPVFRLVLECRERQKMLSTYNWRLRDNGTVGTVIGHHPSTWRKSSRDVNLQNIPKRSELASAFRRMVVAPQGHVLVECVSPESKILLSDMTWLPAGTIKVGDELVGFTVGHRGRFCSSLVTNIRVIQRPRVRVITDKGSTVVAANHPFLARFYGYKRRWMNAESLMGRLGTGALMAFLGSPWQVDNSREGGYLSGFLDGEGWVSRTRSGVAQNSGPTLEYVLGLLRERGFRPSFHKGVTTSGSNAFKYGKANLVENWCIHGMYETMRLLGSVRPRRLFEKQRQVWEGRQTWGKRSEPAKVLRVEPLEDGPVMAIETTSGTYISDGFFSHNCDSSAIEAVLVGYFARSERYIRLAKCGIHDWFNSVVHGEPISVDLEVEQLRAACQSAKQRYSKESREVAKRVVHLTAYRGTPERMQEEYPETFATVAVARRLQNQLLATQPGEDLQRWWKETLDRAAHDRFLINPFGMRHRFFHIYGWDRKYQRYTLGDDAKRAIAFLPQSTASALQDVYVWELWNSNLTDYLRLIVHDSAVLVVPQELATFAATWLNKIFTMPLPELGGLTIGAEVSISEPGGNWAPRSASNPNGMEAWHENDA